MNRIFLWINYFCIVSLLASYFAKLINPNAFWPLAFFGLAYPIILICNLFFIVFWFLQFRWLGLFSLIAVLLGWNSFFNHVQFNSLSTNAEKASSVKVMSYNCMLFDLYNWNNENNKKSRIDIFEMLNRENLDILCLQEFFTSENPKSFDNKKDVGTALGMQYCYSEYTTTLRNEDHWGIATYSRFPIVRTGKIDFKTKTNNICIFTDVLIGKDTVRIYNMHLQSIQFRKEDYKFVDNVLTDKSDQELEHSKNILRRLKRGFIKRADQVQLVNESIRKCPYKVIVCGDFNDTPSSYAYHQIKGELKDAFMERGKGFEKTYRGRMPAFRIDYILHDPDFETLEYKKIEQSITDHFPITARIDIK